jgi:hypothetical protein
VYAMVERTARLEQRLVVEQVRLNAARRRGERLAAGARGTQQLLSLA